RRQPRDASGGRPGRVRLPGHARGARPRRRLAPRRANGRTARPAGRDRGRSRPAGGAGRLRDGLRRSGVPPHARGLRGPGGADRHARLARRRRLRDRLAAPARRAATVDGGRDRGVSRRSGARGGAPLMHNRWHPDLSAIAEVEPGEEIRLETEEGLGGQFTRDSTHEDVRHANLGLGHPLTGPVYVNGAEPGQVLEVELVAYESADYGNTAVIPGFGFLADLFPDPYLVKWEIADGVARSEELPGVAVPDELFAGVIGVAPSHERLESFRRREEELRAQEQLVADPLPGSAVPPEARDGLRTIPPR